MHNTANLCQIMLSAMEWSTNITRHVYLQLTTGNCRHKIKTKMETTVSWTEHTYTVIIQQDAIYQRHYKHRKQTDNYHIEAVPTSLLLITDNNSHISSRYTDIVQIGRTLWNKFQKQNNLSKLHSQQSMRRKTTQIWSVQQLWCNFNQGILRYTTKFDSVNTAGQAAGHRLYDQQQQIRLNNNNATM